MFKTQWDPETGGIILNSHITSETVNIAPRPVFREELDMLGLREDYGWTYPTKACLDKDIPLLWACNKQYFYRGRFVFEVKGANLYDDATVILQPDAEKLHIIPMDIPAMLEKNKNNLFLLESEAIEFIRDTYTMYARAKKSVENAGANRLDFEAMAASYEKRNKTKMAIVREDCDSFDIMPLDTAQSQGKRIYQTTRIDRFLASFSGGKDSQVVLDLVTRAIPPDAFEVIYSDTGYELPSSLELYEQVKTHYRSLYPDLRFATARNHEQVLQYWDSLGTPSDTHRWCCSVMKTAPLYRMLKVEGSNKQARVLTFEGVRAEESTRRSGYSRIGKGVKHDTVINARPILHWSTPEIFLYLFKYALPINPAYKQGMTRVGCLICPFSSEWNEMIANRHYHNNIEPFIQKLTQHVTKAGVRDIEDYIKAGNWKRRASGNLVAQDSGLSILKVTPDLVIRIHNAKLSFEKWLFTIGKYTLTHDGHISYGELLFDKTIYKFQIEKNAKVTNTYRFTLFNANNGQLISLLKRVLYKTTFCINCEVCEVECPTGALSVYPEVIIDRTKCIHCHKCLTFHDKGCIVADSLTITKGNNMDTQTSIDRYKNFGLRDEWLDLFLSDPDNFWESNHGLNPQYQIPSLKNWLKDSEIIDDKNNVTELGRILADIYTDRKELVWEIVWINLTYNSFIARWYASHISCGMVFSKILLEEMIQNEFPAYKGKTIHNAVYQISRTFKESPIGLDFHIFLQLDKEDATREAYDYLSEEALAYSLYKYAAAHNTKMLRVSDFYRDDNYSGVYREFGLSKNAFEKIVRTLNSATNRVMIAELNMGLDNITLRDDLNSLEVLKALIH